MSACSERVTKLENEVNHIHTLLKLVERVAAAKRRSAAEIAIQLGTVASVQLHPTGGMPYSPSAEPPQPARNRLDGAAFSVGL